MKERRASKGEAHRKRANNCAAQKSEVPPPEEWNFPNLQGIQRELCYQYEFLRECLDVALLVFWDTPAAKRIKARLGKQAVARIVNRRTRDARLQELVLRLSPMQWFHEDFPHTPFQRIAHAKREGQAAVFEIDLNYSPAATVAKYHNNMTAKVKDLCVNGQYRDRVLYVDSGIHFGVYPIRINWTLDTDQIKRDFAVWLTKREHGVVKKIDYRRTNASDHLKTLGALRLARTGLPFAKYSAATAEVLKHPSGNPAPLYQNNTAWYNAQNRALQRMRDDFMSEVPELVDRRYKGRTEYHSPTRKLC